MDKKKIIRSQIGRINYGIDMTILIDIETVIAFKLTIEIDTRICLDEFAVV
jgi:hypothetical protein